MTEHTQLKPRDRVLAAQKELIEFERKEKEFRKKDQAGRAAELRLPVKVARHTPKG